MSKTTTPRISDSKLSPEVAKLTHSTWLHRAKEFASDTDLHGFRRVLEARTKFEKLSWVNIIIACILIMIMTLLFSSVQYYSDANVLSKIYAERKDKFPKIEICPSYWINTSRLESYGLFPSEIPTLFYVLSGEGNASEEATQAMTTKLEAWPGSYNEFLLNISYQPEDIVHEDGGNVEIKEATLVVTVRQTCVSLITQPRMEVDPSYVS